MINFLNRRKQRKQNSHSNPGYALSVFSCPIILVRYCLISAPEGSVRAIFEGHLQLVQTVSDGVGQCPVLLAAKTPSQADDKLHQAVDEFVVGSTVAGIDGFVEYAEDSGEFFQQGDADNDGRPDCVAGKDQMEAEDICVSFGGRLCSVAELVVGEASGTGCGLDTVQVWSKTAGTWYTTASLSLLPSLPFTEQLSHARAWLR